MAVERHEHNGLDAPFVRYGKIKDKPGALQDIADNSPQTAITAPTEGETIDAQARTAINDIITKLENLGLVEEN